MKLVVVLVTIFVIPIFAQDSSGGWQDVGVVSDSSPYKEIVEKIYANLNATELKRTGRITNGSPATLGQFPFQIYMYSFRPDGAAFICGGSIIHRRWILTAAHCLEDRVKIEIFMGGINRFATGSGVAIQKSVVTRTRSIILHPDYDTRVTSNDIGLVELPEDALVENSYIGIIGLPRGIDATRNLAGETGTASGYGKTSETSDPSPILNFARLPIVDNLICMQTFGSLILSSNVCAASVSGPSGQQSICNGDSGGPLTIVGQGGAPIVVGISSFISAAGCERGLPQVFARVSSFVPWIEQTTGINFS